MQPIFRSIWDGLPINKSDKKNLILSAACIWIKFKCILIRKIFFGDAENWNFKEKKTKQKQKVLV